VKDSYDFPEVHCKGSDCALLTQFLAHWLPPRFARGHITRTLYKALGNLTVSRHVASFLSFKFHDLCRFFVCMNHALEVLARARDLWLQPLEQDEAFLCMYRAIECYGRLNGAFPDKFKIKPKAHAMCHMVLDLQPRGDPRRLCPNFWSDCCWMDEDFIGRVCRRLVRSVSPQNVLRTVVERYVTLMWFELHQ
jgi:hypothetical protein